jgi:cytidylate kinase
LLTRSEKWLSFVQKILDRSAVTGTAGDPYFGSSYATFLTDEFENIPNAVITEPHTIEDEHYIEAIHDIMRDMAETGDVIFVGRGGHVILNDMDNVLRVGVVAHPEDRVKTLMRRENITESRALGLIQSRDEARKEYFRKFFEIDDPDRADLFHLTINTSEMALEFATDLIVNSLHALNEGKITKSS